MSLLQANARKLMYLYSVVTRRIQNLTLLFSNMFLLKSILLFMCVRLNTQTGSQSDIQTR